MKHHQEACLICGKPLVYFEEGRKMTCSRCKKEALGYAQCQAGHFICDDCHMQLGIASILSACKESKEQDPIALFEEIAQDPNIHMHGPEHHVLAGAALLTAYSNCGGTLHLDSALEEMARRGQAIPGGACGFYGCCGAAVSAGAYLSIALHATPLSTDAWGLCNQLTAQCLQAIGEAGGPRCCKRDCYLAIQQAAKFTDLHLGVSMPLPQRVLCKHNMRNRECIGKRCPFHPAQSQKE